MATLSPVAAGFFRGLNFDIMKTNFKEAIEAKLNDFYNAKLDIVERIVHECSLIGKTSVHYPCETEDEARFLYSVFSYHHGFDCELYKKDFQNHIVIHLI